MTAGPDPALAGNSPWRSLEVTADDEGQRLDVFLSRAIPDASRARIRRGIDAGDAQIAGVARKASFRLSAGDHVEFRLPPPPAAGPEPEPIALSVLFEDDAIAVIDKPPGMVVHPAKGHWSGTLASALVHHFDELSGQGGAVRPGIVHRLDRDTSGVLVVAKTDQAHERLAAQFKARTVRKEYLALVAGAPDRDRDLVDQPIGPHPSHREKMALRSGHPASRPAQTFYEVRERFPGITYLRAEPKTGRTHQIRLHLASVRCPVLCDKLYGGRARITAGELRGLTRQKRLASELADDAVLLGRQALHAHRLSFAHPLSGEPLSFAAPLAPDIERLLLILRQIAPAR